MRTFLVIGIILLLLLQYRYWFGESGRVAINTLQGDLERQRTATEVLQARNRALKQEVRELAEGTDEVEARARLDLGMVRKGETFYQVVDTVLREAEAQAEEQAEEQGEEDAR